MSQGGWFPGQHVATTLDMRQSHRKNPGRGLAVPAIHDARTASDTPQPAATTAGGQHVMASRSRRSSAPMANGLRVIAVAFPRAGVDGRSVVGDTPVAAEPTPPDPAGFLAGFFCAIGMMISNLGAGGRAMFNDRPIDDANLQAGLDEVKAVMARRGLAGACMLVAENEAAFTYGMHAPWSAIRPDPKTPMGFRIRASLEADGEEGRHRKLEGAAHTICQIADFGSMTQDWMEQLKAMLRKTGLEIEHVPFGGRPLPSIGTAP